MASNSLDGCLIGFEMPRWKLWSGVNINVLRLDTYMEQADSCLGLREIMATIPENLHGTTLSHALWHCFTCVGNAFQSSVLPSAMDLPLVGDHPRSTVFSFYLQLSYVNCPTKNDAPWACSTNAVYNTISDLPFDSGMSPKLGKSPGRHCNVVLWLQVTGDPPFPCHMIGRYSSRRSSCTRHIEESLESVTVIKRSRPENEISTSTTLTWVYGSNGILSITYHRRCDVQCICREISPISAPKR